MAKCGCMATVHALVGSCAGCGRIVCAKETQNYSTCPFCTGSVFPPLSADDMRQSGADESTVRAYELKDKLLQFDRETAKRTQVLDAQSDYYTSSTWLDEEEKAAIDAKEKARMISVQRLNRPVEQLELDLATGDINYVRRDSTQGTSSGNYNSISADVSGDSEPLSASSLSVYGTVLSPVSVAEADASLSAYSGGVAENTALAEGRGRVADVYRTIKSNRLSAKGGASKITGGKKKSLKVQYGNDEDDF